MLFSIRTQTTGLMAVNTRLDSMIGIKSFGMREKSYSGNEYKEAAIEGGQHSVVLERQGVLDWRQRGGLGRLQLYYFRSDTCHWPPDQG